MSKNLIFLFIFLSSNTWAMKPVREYAATPDQYGLKYKEENIKTNDGFNIKIWDISPTKKIKKYINFSVVLSSSDAGNMSYFLAPAIALANEGIRVIMFDYRGYGKSDDFKIDSTLLFHKEFLIDFEQVIGYTKDKYPKNKIGSLGFSMGGYFPMITKQKLDFIIADSPMLNPQKIIEILKETNLKLPPNTHAAKFNETPTLFFFANEDKVIKLADVLIDNTDKLNQSKTSIVPYNGKHIEGIYASIEFTPHILRFLSGLQLKNLPNF